jgi:cell division protein FtsN
VTSRIEVEWALVRNLSLLGMKMVMNKAFAGVCLGLLLAISGCSRQQSDWEKTRAANTTDSYEQFLKKYPSGEFTAQAQARVKELYEERDWQKARDADTQEAYQAFLKQYPEGKWTEEARIRVENFSLAQAPSNGTPGAADGANTAANPGSGATPAGNTPGGGATAAGTGAGAAAAAASSPASAPTPPVSPPVTPKSKVVASPKSRAGTYGIQLGAFKSSADAANRRWAHLDTEYPKLLAGLSPTVSPKKSTAGTLYRLQVVGITEKHARAICKTLKAKSQACVLIHPA